MQFIQSYMARLGSVLFENNVKPSESGATAQVLMGCTARLNDGLINEIALEEFRRISDRALRFFPYAKFEIRLRECERRLSCDTAEWLEPDLHDAAHDSKQARRSSDAGPEAKTSL